MRQTIAPCGVEMVRRRVFRAGVVTAALLCGWAGSAVGRQEGGAGGGAGGAEAAPAPASAPAVTGMGVAAGETAWVWDEGAFCDVVTQRVLHLLRSIDAPSVEQYRAAALGLRIARRYRPADAEVLRAEIEAWDAAQDVEAALAATRELVRLDPTDTVALLRVAAARITGLQDADQRLKAYDGLINSKTLDAAVRSRLALDAALLARETGDEKGFLDLLLLSTSLDVTHKEAAALTVTTYLDKSKDPVERFDLLSSVLLADPHDPEAHRNVAFEMRRQLAFKASARFLEMARSLNAAEGRSPTAAQQLEYFQSVWDSAGPEKALEKLDKLLDMDVIAEKLRRDSLTKSGRDPGPDRPIRLPPSLERVRLMINVARMDDAGAENNVKSLEGSHNDALTRLATDPPRAPEDGGELPVEQRGETIRRTLLTDWVWVRLFSGTRLEGVEADLEELSKPGAEGGAALGQQALDRFRGWLLVMRGESAEGRRLLEPLQASDPTALWALAVAAQREGEIDKAAGYLERVAREFAASALGSTARQRWERLKGVPFDVGPVANTLNGQAMRFAPWMESAINDSRTYTSLTIEPTALTLGPLDRVDARISLTNISRHPMGLGLGRSMNPRVLVGVRLVMGGRALSAQIRPEVVNLGRRLRLMPGESVGATVWAARGDLSRAFEQRPTLPAELRWMATQGFIFNEGAFRPGSSSVRAQSLIFKRDPLRSTVEAKAEIDRRRGDAPAPPPAAISAEALAWSVLNEGDGAAYRALALACFRVGPTRRDSDIDPVTETDARTLSAALTERFGKASAGEVGFMVPRLEVAEAFDDTLRGAALDAVKRLNHPALWVVALTAVPQAAENEGFASAATEASSGDADLAAFVGLAKGHFNPSKSAAPKRPEEGVRIVPVGGEGSGMPGGGEGPTP